MLDQVIKMAAGQLTQQLTGQAEVPQDQVSNIAEVAGSSIFESIAGQVTSGNLGAITEMLSGSQTHSSNPVVNSIAENVIENLVAKCGLNPGMADTVAKIAVPFVMNMFNDKVQQQGGVDVAGLVSSALGGGNQGGGGLLGGLVGNLLGGGNQNQGGIGQQVLGSVLSNLLK